MREFKVTDWDRTDLLATGLVEAFGMRPQRIAVAEPYCLACGKHAWPTRIFGRWDSERKATALPFDPVAVCMTCGCVAGNPTLAGPNPSEHVPACNAQCDEHSHYLIAPEATS